MTETDKSAQLSDGRILTARGPSRAVDEIIIRLLGPDAGVLDKFRMPSPNAGFGGHRFVLSPSEQLAVFAYFSGQSEEAYVVLRVSDRLTQVGAMPYVSGEAASYGFSSDERILLMALPILCSEWWELLDDEDEAPPDDARNRSLSLGQVRLHDLATGSVSIHEMRAIVPDGWTAKEDDYDADLRPSFVSDTHLALSLPWGEELLDLPLPSILELPVR